MSIASDLERLMAIQDDLAAASATAVERAYAQRLGGVATRLTRLVMSLGADGSGRMTPSIAGVSAIAGQLATPDALGEVWREWVGRLSALIKIQEDYGRRVSGQGALWLPADKSALELLVGAWDGAAMPQAGSLAARYVSMTQDQQARLSQMTARHILGRLPQRDFEQAVTQELGRDLASARRLIHDETLGFARAAHELKARQLELDYYRYSGPDDQVTRPFCARLIGRVLSREEIDKLDNGQTGVGSAIVACGGYNCRHRWAAVSPDFYTPEEWAALRSPAADR